MMMDVTAEDAAATSSASSSSSSNANILRMQEYQRRLHEGIIMLRNANNIQQGNGNGDADASSSAMISQVEFHLREVCWYLEDWKNQFDNELLLNGNNSTGGDGGDASSTATTTAQATSTSSNNPFSTYLAQARHRLGQIALQKGDLVTASEQFLMVLLHDPNALSISARAMTWYDVGLIFLRLGDVCKAQYSLNQAYSTLMSQQEVNDIHRAEPLFKIIQQALMRTMMVATNRVNDGNAMIVASQLPWSNTFTKVTYEFDNSGSSEASSPSAPTTNNNVASRQQQHAQQQQVYRDLRQQHVHHQYQQPQYHEHFEGDENIKRLFDPKAWAAAAA